jgi:hypothetical protein
MRPPAARCPGIGPTRTTSRLRDEDPVDAMKGRPPLSVGAERMLGSAHNVTFEGGRCEPRPRRPPVRRYRSAPAPQCASSSGCPSSNGHEDNTDEATPAISDARVTHR